MKFHEVVENTWQRTFENYLFTASAVARVTDIRKALEPLLTHANNMLKMEVFKTRTDSRFFIIEMEGMRVATFFQNTKRFEVSVMPAITHSIFDTFDTFIQQAIKYQTLVYQKDALKAATDPLLKVMQNQSNLLDGIVPKS